MLEGGKGWASTRCEVMSNLRFSSTRVVLQGLEDACGVGQAAAEKAPQLSKQKLQTPPNLAGSLNLAAHGMDAVSGATLLL